MNLRRLLRVFHFLYSKILFQSLLPLGLLLFYANRWGNYWQIERFLEEVLYDILCNRDVKKLLRLKSMTCSIYFRHFALTVVSFLCKLFNFSIKKGTDCLKPQEYQLITTMARKRVTSLWSVCISVLLFDRLVASCTLFSRSSTAVCIQINET